MNRKGHENGLGSITFVVPFPSFSPRALVLDFCFNHSSLIVDAGAAGVAGVVWWWWWCPFTGFEGASILQNFRSEEACWSTVVIHITPAQ
jgi:hypothetical protein